jgi:multicomponent Na+:H+ antiporter subunit C
MIESFNYWISIFLMMAGLYSVMTHGNFVKKMMGLSIFQVSVLLLYTSVGSVKGGSAPIMVDGVVQYVNPVPHVLMLTAIVVGVAVMAVGLAIIVRIKEAYGTIEEDEVVALDNEFNLKEREIDDHS